VHYKYVTHCTVLHRDQTFGSVLTTLDIYSLYLNVREYRRGNQKWKHFTTETPLMIKFTDTVKPVLSLQIQSNLQTKKKWSFKTGDLLKQVQFSMTGQEKSDLLIQVAT
jgi:hypothetical protein